MEFNQFHQPSTGTTGATTTGTGWQKIEPNRPSGKVLRAPFQVGARSVETSGATFIKAAGLANLGDRRVSEIGDRFGSQKSAAKKTTLQKQYCTIKMCVIICNIPWAIHQPFF